MNEQTDHDLLLELRGDVKALSADVKDIKDNTQFTLRDHETRLRFLERYMWGAIGAIAVVEVIIGWYLTNHK